MGICFSERFKIGQSGEGWPSFRFVELQTLNKNTMAKDSQCIQILNDLHTGIRISVHGTNNSISSFKKYECERLASRVGDLRKEGFDIKTDMVKTESGKRVAEYYLEPEPKPKPRPSFDIWETLPLFV